jgi:hypothetical protein
MKAEAYIEGYAYGKLSELVERLFCDVRPAREKLLEHFHLIFIISLTDFKTERHRAEWANIQRVLKGKIKNYGSERIPSESITVRNATLERVLQAIWRIYAELPHDS